MITVHSNSKALSEPLEETTNDGEEQFHGGGVQGMSVVSKQPRPPPQRRTTDLGGYRTPTLKPIGSGDYPSARSSGGTTTDATNNNVNVRRLLPKPRFIFELGKENNEAESDGLKRGGGGCGGGGGGGGGGSSKEIKELGMKMFKGYQQRKQQKNNNKGTTTFRSRAKPLTTRNPNTNNVTAPRPASQPPRPAEKAANNRDNNNPSPYMRAAGTPARTLRERIALLQREKGDLEERRKEKEEENDTLKQQVATLEQALKDMPRRSVSAPSGEEQKFRSGSGSGIRGGGGGVEENAQIAALQRELFEQSKKFQMLSEEYDALEQRCIESESARRGLAVRYTYRCIDEDHDGLLEFEQVARFNIFEHYPPTMLKRAFDSWCFPPGAGNKMSEDDLVKFLSWAEDKSSKESMSFWFRAADLNGDGYLDHNDLVEMFRAANGFQVLQEADFLCQIFDMAKCDDKKGISLSDLKRSRLGPGILNVLFNHNGMMINRSTAEWSKVGEFAL